MFIYIKNQILKPKLNSDDSDGSDRSSEPQKRKIQCFEKAPLGKSNWVSLENVTKII